jgi:hypothetical protein
MTLGGFRCRAAARSGWNSSISSAELLPERLHLGPLADLWFSKQIAQLDRPATEQANVTHNHAQSTELGRDASLQGSHGELSAPYEEGLSGCRDIGIEPRLASVVGARGTAFNATGPSLRGLGCLPSVSAIGPATRKSSPVPSRLESEWATRTDRVESSRETSGHSVVFHESTFQKNGRTTCQALVDLSLNPRKSSIEPSRPFGKTFGFLVGQRSTFPKIEALTLKSRSSVHFKRFANVVNSEVLFSKLAVSTSFTDPFFLILARSRSCDDAFFLKRDLFTLSKSLFHSPKGVRKGSEKCLWGHNAERRSQSMSTLKGKV